MSNMMPVCHYTAEELQKVFLYNWLESESKQKLCLVSLIPPPTPADLTLHKV